MNRSKVVALLFAVSAVATSCAAQSAERTTTDARVAAPVVALSSVEQFATAFNADKGVPRLILPISPT